MIQIHVILLWISKKTINLWKKYKSLKKLYISEKTVAESTLFLFHFDSMFFVLFQIKSYLVYYDQLFSIF